VRSPQVDSATQAPPAGQTVHPGDCVFVGGVLRRKREELLQIREPDALLCDPGAGHALEADLGPEDESGEAQAPDRGREELGVGILRAHFALP
jgi:hypothetical protein